MNPKRLLRWAADAQLQQMGEPCIVDQCQYGSWYQTRNACAPAMVTELRDFADREQGEFWEVHAKREGDIARIMLDTTTAHKAELKRHGEDQVLTNKPEGKILAGEMERVWARNAALTPPAFVCGAMGESELGRSKPGSWGQAGHMDITGNGKSMIMNTGDPGAGPSATAIAIYPWQPYPENLSTDSTVPDTPWNELPVHVIHWQSGDCIMMFMNRVHWSPPNPSIYYRLITFCGEAAGPGQPFSDSSVIDRAAFFALKR